MLEFKYSIKKSSAMKYNLEHAQYIGHPVLCVADSFTETGDALVDMLDKHFPFYPLALGLVNQRLLAIYPDDPYVRDRHFSKFILLTGSVATPELWLTSVTKEMAGAGIFDSEERHSAFLNAFLDEAKEGCYAKEGVKRFYGVGVGVLFQRVNTHLDGLEKATRQRDDLEELLPRLFASKTLVKVCTAFSIDGFEHLYDRSTKRKIITNSLGL